MRSWLYPTEGLPPALRALARGNPISYAVDAIRHALGQPAEFPTAVDAAVVLGTTVVAFGVTALLFDPAQRFLASRRGRAPLDG